MCNFFSCISKDDKVLFFKPEDIVIMMAEDNPNKYDWNSHTSIAHYHKIKSEDEATWDRWEYNPNTNILTLNSGNNINANEVQKKVENYLKGKNITYLINLYGKNSGNRNSGYYNSGNWNSGDWNSGNYNSNTVIGHFCSQEMFFLFNRPCSKDEAEKIKELYLENYFRLSEWINVDEMTKEEKELNPSHKITGGYLKTITYKEAWAKIPEKIIIKIMELKNFDADIFFEITGIRK